MRRLQLINNIIISTLIISVFGCVDEPCLNINELDNYSIETKEWFVNDNIGNQIITDENGISQTLIISSRDSISYENSVEDNCGNIYGSFRFDIQYNTSLSPIHLSIHINGSGLTEDGFYLRLQTSNSSERKSTTYDFVTETCKEKNATIIVLDQLEIFNKIYNDVLKISFNKTFSANDIKTIFYSKGHGVIKFIKENKNTFVIN
jgi:hypothetical protein